MGRNVNSDLVEFSIRESSLGNILLVAREGKLIELDISNETEYEIRKELMARYPDAVNSTKPFRMTYLLLDRYLRGQKLDFDVEVDLSGKENLRGTCLLSSGKCPMARSSVTVSSPKKPDTRIQPGQQDRPVEEIPYPSSSPVTGLSERTEPSAVSGWG